MKKFERLRRAGLAVDVTRVRAHATSGGWYTLFLARRAE
jgi:aryl carrier-like protein